MFDESLSFKPQHDYGRLKSVHARTVAILKNIGVKQGVKCPLDIDRDDWMTVFIIRFYNNLNIIFGNLQDRTCTRHTCPIMNAGPKYQYLWVDGEKILKPIKCSAPEYVEYLMDWVQEKLEKGDIYPLDSYDYRFDFIDNIKQTMAAIGGEDFLNSSLKDFIFFVEEYKLLDERELMPLEVLIKTLYDKEAEAENQQEVSKERKLSTSSEEPLINFVDPIIPKNEDNCEQRQTRAYSEPAVKKSEQAVEPVKEEPKVEKEEESCPTFDFIMPPPPISRQTTPPAVVEQNSNGESALETLLRVNNLSEEELLEVSDTIAPLPSDPPQWNPPEPGKLVAAVQASKKSAFEFSAESPEEPSSSSDLYFDAYDNYNNKPAQNNVEGNDEYPPLSAVEGYTPRVAIIGVGWDFENQVALLKKVGYEIMFVWTDNPDFIAKMSSENYPITVNLDDILSATVDLILIHDETFAKRRDNLLVSIIEHCQESQISYGLSPSSLSLAKRKEILNVLQKTDLNPPISFVSHPTRFLYSAEKLKSILTNHHFIGDILSMNVSLHVPLGRDNSAARKKQFTSCLLAAGIDIFCWCVDLEDSITEISSHIDSTAHGNIATMYVKGHHGIPGTISASTMDICVMNTIAVTIQGTLGNIQIDDSQVTLQTEQGVQVIPLQKAFVKNYELANLEMYKRLKLHLFADQSSEVNLTPTEINLMEQLYTTLPTIHEGYRNMRIVEAVRRQQMMDRIKVNTVSEILKVSPKSIKESAKSSKNVSQKSSIAAASDVSKEIDAAMEMFNELMNVNLPLPPPNVKQPSSKEVPYTEYRPMTDEYFFAESVPTTPVK